jgi:hypothetical protein
MGAHRKAKKSELKTTERQYSVIKALSPISRLMTIANLQQKRYPAKVMLWLAVSEYGESEPVRLRCQ